MADVECTGYLRRDWPNELAWAHWMFACDDACPMEIRERAWMRLPRYGKRPGRRRDESRG